MEHREDQRQRDQIGSSTSESKKDPSQARGSGERGQAKVKKDLEDETDRTEGLADVGAREQRGVREDGPVGVASHQIREQQTRERRCYKEAGALSKLLWMQAGQLHLPQMPGYSTLSTSKLSKLPVEN